MNKARARVRADGAAPWFLVAAVAVVGACAQGGDSGSAATSDAPAAAVEQPAGSERSEPPGSGASTDRQTEPVDVALASEGEQLFSRRGCVACHKIGAGRLVGPDLMGVTERRSYDWIFAMVTAPDSMLQSDSIARALYAEYFTPMPNQKVEPQEARALYEYLRARTEGVMQSSAVSAPNADVAMGGRRHRHGTGMGSRGPMRAMAARTDEQGAGRGPPAGRGARAGHGGRHRHHQSTSL